MDLFLKFSQHCAAEQLVRPGDRLLLAVSGGLDSCVLLDFFCQLRDQEQLQLAVAHVNHQLRGSESDDDEKFVQALVQDAGLPFYAERVDVLAYARKHKRSLETSARELRYQALEKCRQNWQARSIVTAHTQDDQAETILAHLLRGCGLAGLAGMATEVEVKFHESEQIYHDGPTTGSAIKILRPLLPFSRAQIEEYARWRRLQWREDRSNANTQFRRNRIRHELLPLVKTHFNPQINQSLGRLASIATTAERYLQAEAAARLPEVIKERQTGKIILDLELFWKYFPIIQRYVIRAVMQELARYAGELSFDETTRLLTLLQRPLAGKTVTGKRYIWRHQIDVRVDHDGAVFQKMAVWSEKDKFPLAVTLGRRCEIPGTAWEILIERQALPPDWRQQVNPYSQFIDAEKNRGELRLRFPQPGDRFVPLGTPAATSLGSGSKTLADFFTDLKVPQHRRPEIPILAGDAIIWVCGYRLDDRFKITPTTRTVLHLQLLPH